MRRARIPDVVVIGAGAMGGWTALHLIECGARVRVIDDWGPGNVRASSGGESRIIRAGYGRDALYTAWAWRALATWKRCEKKWGKKLFHQTGVLWLAGDGGEYERETFAEIRRQKIPVERLSARELGRKFPQISGEGISFGVYEPKGGALLASRACRAVVDALGAADGSFEREEVLPPQQSHMDASRLQHLATASGRAIRAGIFVFACGPWLPKIFPDLLRSRIRVTQQDEIYFGFPAGDDRFVAPEMPAWIDFSIPAYGIPPLEGRGFKVGLDSYGPAFDPDTSERLVRRKSIEAVRQYVKRRFPAFRDEPIVETRVCQYESTSNEHYIIDRHPQWENVWILGGGSGHAFKMGPVLGEYAASHIAGRTKEPPLDRFLLNKGNRSRAYRRR